MRDDEAALVELGRLLRAAAYTFVTVTPETHRRVLPRRDARTLRDVFGWSRWFAPSVLPRPMLEALRAAGALEEDGARCRSRVRFSSVGPELFVHSAYPTDTADAVFFGPDTYRFCAFVRRAALGRGRLVDVGCGSGAGGLILAGLVERVVLADINTRALSFACVNAELAGVSAKVDLVESDVLGSVADPIDLVISNPPYLVDAGERVYRHGGGAYGTELAVRITRDALARLSPGGRLLLYSGAPVLEGDDLLRRALEPLLEAARAEWQYEELDPDVFGEELDRPDYAALERIAAVGLCARLP
jgi:SAM-dependent methyltransferase